VNEFAPGYDRTNEGWIIFPRDTELRHRLFPFTDPSEHIAKANMLMVEALVEYVSESGETICDPFAGTGTILVAAPLGRKVLVFELVDTFVQTIELNTIGIQQTYPDVKELISLIPGNAANILPIPDVCDHMIFSPPYPMGLKKKGSMDKTSVDLGYSQATEYSEGVDNFTNMNPFIYHQKIEQFYKKCFGSIRSGGTLTVIIKDKMEKGKRVMQADRTLRDCEKIGFKQIARNKWYARGGGYSAINRAAGLETVDDGDLITMRKP